MPTLVYLNQSYDCATAIKGDDYIRLLDDKGCLIASFDGISSFAAFTLQNGSYTSPTPDHDCYLAVIRDDGTLAKGGHKCSDIPTTAADIGAAPAGYGLGVNANPVTDLNDTTLKNGFYTLSGVGCANTPSLLPSSGLYGVLLVQRRANTIYQRVSYDGQHSSRMYVTDSGWGEWEYENPNFDDGQEYRTTERYEGKPVYAKVVSFTTTEQMGSMDSVTTITIPHGISNNFTAIETVGHCPISSGRTLPLPYTEADGERGYFFGVIDSTNITLILKKSAINANRTVYITIRYTK